VQFAEFLQHSSLKRLGILYQSTCVGFGYGLRVSYFQEHLPCPEQSNKPRQVTAFVTSHWPRNIYLVPIDYAFRPHLRGRLTLRRLALRRNPWTFGESLSPSLSLLMSAFSLPIPPPDLAIELHRLTERSATACLRTPIPSANGLSPVTFSAQDRLTSELLRFL
jgi:hypothetical protein